MTARSANSNCENQLCNFPLSLHVSLGDENETNLSSVFHWINSFEFTRPKKTIARDFSDASKNKYFSYYILIHCYCLLLLLN